MSDRLDMKGMAEVMEIVFDECRRLRSAGQKEYAHNDETPFANFERAGADLNLDRKMVLWIFAMKHRDGIASFLKGHRSQREDIRGRINDLIVYLVLLRGMIEEEDPKDLGYFARRAADAAGDKLERPSSMAPE